MDHRGCVLRNALAEAGADVGCADIDEESARAAAAAVKGLGRRGAAIGCDVTAEAEVKAVVTRTVEVLGRLDILFNNAGIADPQALLLHQYQTADWRAVLAVWTWTACSSAHGKQGIQVNVLCPRLLPDQPD